MVPPVSTTLVPGLASGKRRRRRGVGRDWGAAKDLAWRDLCRWKAWPQELQNYLLFRCFQWSNHTFLFFSWGFLPHLCWITSTFRLQSVAPHRSSARIRDASLSQWRTSNASAAQVRSGAESNGVGDLIQLSNSFMSRFAVRVFEMGQTSQDHRLNWSAHEQICQVRLSNATYGFHFGPFDIPLFKVAKPSTYFLPRGGTKI